MAYYLWILYYNSPITLTAQSNNHDYGNIARSNVFDSPTKTHIAAKLSWYLNTFVMYSTHLSWYTLVLVVEHTKQLPKIF